MVMVPEEVAGQTPKIRNGCKSKQWVEVIPSMQIYKFKENSHSSPSPLFPYHALWLSQFAIMFMRYSCRIWCSVVLCFTVTTRFPWYSNEFRSDFLLSPYPGPAHDRSPVHVGRLRSKYTPIDLVAPPTKRKRIGEVMVRLVVLLQRKLKQQLKSKLKSKLKRRWNRSCNSSYS